VGCFFYILLANKNWKHLYSITVTWTYSCIALHVLIWYTHSYYSLCMICLCLLKDTTYTDRSASYLDLHLKTECEWGWRTKNNFTTKEMILMFPLSTFHLYVATFQQRLHMGYISLSLCDIPEFVVPIRISLIEGCY
jgi:hypothetical protein